MADAFAFTRDSAQQIADAVRQWRNTPADATTDRARTPQSRQLQLFRRTSAISDLDFGAARGTVEAVQAWDVPGYDYDALSSPCLATAYETPPDVPEAAPAFTVNVKLLYEGFILPGELFLAAKLGDTWYAVGAGHTAIVGTFSANSGAPTATIGCELVIPVSFISDPTTDVSVIEGARVLAKWDGANFYITVWACPDGTDP